MICKNSPTLNLTVAQVEIREANPTETCSGPLAFYYADNCEQVEMGPVNNLHV